MDTEKQTPLVLVATDFSQIGDHAIAYAAHLVRQFHGKIVILHVLDKATRSMLKQENKDASFLDVKLKQEADKIMKISGVEASWLVKEGSIFNTIGKVAREKDAIFLVIGTHGKKGIQHLLGSFILKVIKRSPVPAFAIQGPVTEFRFKNVVYPLDLNIGSKQKVKWAVHYNKLVGAQFHIFVEHHGQKDLKIKIQADLNLVTRIMEQHGLSYTITRAKDKGPFVTQTAQFAKDKKADFIMVSTDPEKISWAFWGSSDENLIYNKEKIPVMCINAKDLNVIIGGL